MGIEKYTKLLAEKLHEAKLEFTSFVTDEDTQLSTIGVNFSCQPISLKDIHNVFKVIERLAWRESRIKIMCYNRTIDPF